ASQTVIVENGHRSELRTTPRLCINYQPINKFIEIDNFPIMRMDDAIDFLIPRHKYMTNMDIKKGYYNIRLTEDSKKYTAFVTQDGQFEFNFAPFGLKDIPGGFARA